MKSEMGFFVGNCSALFEGPLPEPADPPAGQGLDLRRFLRVQVNGTLSMQKGIPALAELLETFRFRCLPSRFCSSSRRPSSQPTRGWRDISPNRFLNSSLRSFSRKTSRSLTALVKRLSQAKSSRKGLMADSGKADLNCERMERERLQATRKS